jgi:hypothetical protein
VKNKGFVLVSPDGQMLAETFRPTREAAKGWLARVQDEGKYREWQYYYRKGWRCKAATIQIEGDPK